MKHVVATLLLLLGLPAQALGEKAEECTGCHTAKRTVAQQRFGNGLGRWTDAQCFGCHAELNDVAVKRHQRVNDPRYVAVPVREERLKSMATVSPLSYMSAPEDVEPGGAVPRISLERLGDFLKRPSTLSLVEGGRAPRMMAYPDLRPRELAEIARMLGVKTVARTAQAVPLSAAQRQRADALWASRCKSCHAGEQRLSGRSAVTLGLFTPEWIHAYANNRVSSPRPETRTMPEVPLDLEEARLLHRLFGALRTEEQQALDARVAALALEASPMPAQLPPGFVNFLWGPFFRTATCVHCHATSPRAARAFTANEAGMKQYLRERSGRELWVRLATRHVEDRHGLVAARPGMPMAGAPIPQETLGLIGRWVLERCPDPQGKTWCQP
ncbi:hypothetical protein [Comamonas sp. JC664]|uniref:hypothetical protein n=1 Tax=Comamonas sp. JC664 TaxID=2801917 RepID=UPI00174B95B5|nr:hypothetical protein [Comamonas sp. JC664]MBL0698029.1 hypothetical protein [Comamonas sp. JC664]GHG70929.1 hypothetical protein GCM10012319_16310 [Comamonas sp. KCTC 72670]